MYFTTAFSPFFTKKVFLVKFVVSIRLNGITLKGLVSTEELCRENGVQEVVRWKANVTHVGMLVLGGIEADLLWKRILVMFVIKTETYDALCKHVLKISGMP